MKNLFVSLTILAFLFCGCKKDKPDSKKDRNSVQKEAAPFTIKIDMENRVQLDIDSVYAVILTPSEEKSLILARAGYDGNGFTIFIPSYLDEVNMVDIEKVLIKNHEKEKNFVIISDSTAKTSFQIKFDAYKNGIFQGDFIHAVKDCGGICFVRYYYSNADVKLEGDFDENPFFYHFDIHFTSGINILFDSFIYTKKPKTITKTMNIPSEAKWYFRPEESIELL